MGPGRARALGVLGLFFAVGCSGAAAPLEEGVEAAVEAGPSQVDAAPAPQPDAPTTPPEAAPPAPDGSTPGDPDAGAPAPDVDAAPPPPDAGAPELDAGSRPDGAADVAVEATHDAGAPDTASDVGSPADAAPDVTPGCSSYLGNWCAMHTAEAHLWACDTTTTPYDGCVLASGTGLPALPPGKVAFYCCP